MSCLRLFITTPNIFFSALFASNNMLLASQSHDLPKSGPEPDNKVCGETISNPPEAVNAIKWTDKAKQKTAGERPKGEEIQTSWEFSMKLR